jgi:DNA repair exonuclease SbcCD ATPase subunit
MVEPIMYFAIGFLVAALLGLMFVPLVHNRAVRLTMRRLEAATPLTLAEIRADKDQLRAEFAMSTRRLEMSVEQMKARTTAQLAELGKKSDAVNQLKKELSDKTAAYFALEAHDKTLLEQLRASEEEFQQKTNALREAERVLADKEAELSKLTAELGDQSLAADSQRVELAALRTQVEAMKVTVGDYERTMKDTEERLARERSDAATTASDLSEAHGKLEGLNARTGDLERQLVAQTAEAELFNRRIRELEGRLGEQGKFIAEREYEIERMRGETEAGSKIEGDLRRELASIGQRNSAVVEKYKSDVAQLEAQLAIANEERSKLQSEIESLKREAESSWASERVENALLRERINDVAAEVARLTAALEGPDSPIDALLAGTHDLTLAAGPSNGNGTSGIALGRGEAGPARIAPSAGQKSTLADRIRALQSSASRVAKSN